MSEAGAIRLVNDLNLDELLAAERAVLILTRSDCGHCHQYTAQIEALHAAGRLDGIVVGKLVLDEPGSTQFKRANHWLARLASLPYTVLYRRGEQVDAFAASRGSYLLERIDEALVGAPRAA